MYKKILATNDPRFEGIKKSWSYWNRAENLLNNSNTKKSLNTGSENSLSSKTAAELCFDIENKRGTQWEQRFQNEANKQNINCKEVISSVVAAL